MIDDRLTVPLYLHSILFKSKYVGDRVVIDVRSGSSLPGGKPTPYFSLSRHYRGKDPPRFPNHCLENHPIPFQTLPTARLRLVPLPRCLGRAPAACFRNFPRPGRFKIFLPVLSDFFWNRFEH
jgi:hypothetical protein